MENQSAPLHPYVDRTDLAQAMSIDGVMAVMVTARPDSWTVAFKPRIDYQDRPSVDAWHAFEWVAWFAHDLERSDCFSGVEPTFEAYPHAAPPWLNEPGHMFTLCFTSDESRRSLVGFVATYIRLWNDTHESPKLIAP